MKFFSLILALFFAQSALAQTPDYSKEGTPLPQLSITREFACQVSVKSASGLVLGKATLLDVVVPGEDYDADKETSQRSEITVDVAALNLKVTAYSERYDEDPELRRDEKSDGNWKGLQIMLNAKTEEVVALRSTTEQIGKKQRDYSLAIVNQKTQEQNIGLAVCTVK